MEKEQSVFDSRTYKISRGAYSAQCAFEYFTAILSSDAFLAKLLKSLGMSDSATGIISSLISVTFLFQLLSVPLAGRLKNVKKPMILLDTVSQLLFACLYTVPFMPLGGKGVTTAVIMLILSAYLTLYLNSSVCYKWGNSFVSPDKRGSFSSVKEMISLLSGMVFTLVMGFVTDSFEKKGNLKGAFAFISVCMVIICAFNFLCFSLIKEKSLSESAAVQSFREVSKHTFGNPGCRKAMLLTAVTECARYITVGFMGTYKTVNLGFSVSAIQIMNVGANVGRFIISKPLGTYSDRKTYADGYFLGNLITLFSYLTGIFTSPSSKWLMPVHNALYQMGLAGTGQNTSNMMYAYVDDEYVLSAIAVNNSVRGVSGFASSFIGSMILDRIQKNGNTLLGLRVYGQQVLCFISAAVLSAALIFNKKVVSKLKEEKK